jgi:hypothetical protein
MAKDTKPPGEKLARKSLRNGILLSLDFIKDGFGVNPPNLFALV